MHPYSILVDSTTLAVLTASYHAPAVVFVSECTMDTAYVSAANVPHADKTLFLIKADPEEYPQWTWNYKERAFFETSAETLTDELRALSRLVTAKMKTVSYMIYRINYRRHKVRTGLDFQESIYLTKQMQAQRLKDSDYDERLITESPYVVQYADAIGIPLEQAADEILLQSKLDHEFLAKTEKVRMQYFTAVKRAKTPQELESILAAFKREA